MDSNLITSMRVFVAGLGYVLWGARWHQQGHEKHLQIFIDNDKGIDVEDCANVSRGLSAWLDVEYPIVDKYVLEVSSPGMDRLLFEEEQYKKYIGQRVLINLYEKQSGRKKWTGTIHSCEQGQVSITDRDIQEGKVGILISDIREARLQPE